MEEHILETPLGLKKLTDEEKAMVCDVFRDALATKERLIDATMDNIRKSPYREELHEREIEIHEFVSKFDKNSIANVVIGCTRDNDTLSEIATCVSDRTGFPFATNGIINLAGNSIKRNLRESILVEF